MKENKRGRFALIVSVLLHIVLLTALGRLLPDSENAPVAMLEFELISTVQAAGHPSPALETPAPPLPHSGAEPPSPQQPPSPDKKPVETVTSASVENTVSNTAANDNGVSFAQAAQTPDMNGVGVGNNPGEPPAGAGVGTASAPPKVLKPPQLLHKVEPAYPEKARRENLEGKVVIRLEVTKNGSVAQATIEQSSGQQELDNSALAAVKKWRFVPAKDAANAPIRSFTTVPVVFTLN